MLKYLLPNLILFFLILKNLSLQKRSLKGWVFGMVSQMICCLYIFLSENYELIISNIVYFSLDLYGFMKWQKEGLTFFKKLGKLRPKLITIKHKS
jgi:hypothetical protein